MTELWILALRDAAWPREPLRASEGVGIPAYENRLRGSQIGSCGFPGASERFLSNDEGPPVGFHGRHTFACAMPTRGGLCDCQPVEAPHVPDLRTTGRGFTYDLARMLS